MGSEKTELKITTDICRKDLLTRELLAVPHLLSTEANRIHDRHLKIPASLHPCIRCR